jgi:hypothetical protein
VNPLKATAFSLAVELIQDPGYRINADGRLEFSFFVHCSSLPKLARNLGVFGLKAGQALRRWASSVRAAPARPHWCALSLVSGDPLKAACASMAPRSLNLAGC